MFLTFKKSFKVDEASNFLKCKASPNKLSNTFLTLSTLGFINYMNIPKWFTLVASWHLFLVALLLSSFHITIKCVSLTSFLLKVNRLPDKILTSNHDSSHEKLFFRQDQFMFGYFCEIIHWNNLGHLSPNFNTFMFNVIVYNLVFHSLLQSNKSKLCSQKWKIKKSAVLVLNELRL